MPKTVEDLRNVTGLVVYDSNEDSEPAGKTFLAWLKALFFA